ncbi:sensor histidine kinase [Brachybacterium sp. AOP43-C2-M15]|uniref:sensor histidine kinase n=1 Tax=Brachybacterium sp. AOP43-C2-M15 TaxID=3457661 RepID=UPI004033E622
MGRLGTEGWAGVAMLVIAVAVALPALLGLADPLIPRPLWALALAGYVLAVLATGAPTGDRARRAALALAVVLSWVLVLTVPGMGLLLIIVVVTAAISTYVVTLPVSLALAVLNTGVVALATSLVTAGWVEVLLLSGFYLLIQLATVFSTTTLLREKRMRTELARTQVDLRAAGVLLEDSVRTAERLRISRELHDLIGHQLTVLTLNLEAARHLEGDEARRHVDRADQVARDLLGDVRATVGEMRAGPTDLDAALRSMVEGVPGLEVSIAVDPDLRLGEVQRTAFIRLAQEAVTNTIRHAEASRLRIEVTQGPEGVTLVARDDGLGARSPQPGNGLRGLRERFEQLGGEVTVESRRGFSVRGRLAGP